MIETLVKTAWNLMHETAAAFGFGIASYRQPERKAILSNVQKIRHDREMLLTPLEAAQLFSAVRATAKLGGDMAEVGVYRGASARLIHNADPSRTLHLFDTFEGLPQPYENDIEFRRGRFRKGQFSCSLSEVAKYIGNSENIRFHKGIFPVTGECVKDLRFSFVHVDVDLYASSLSVMEFFYTRLVPGGIILSHDVASCQGPRTVVASFFRNLPEPVIELPGDQAIIVKI